MTQVWWFLLDLFFLGYVEDPETGISFCMPQNHEWSFYFEVFSTVDTTYCTSTMYCIHCMYCTVCNVHMYCAVHMYVRTYVLYVSLYVHVYICTVLYELYILYYVYICMYALYVCIDWYVPICTYGRTHILMCVLHMHCMYVCTLPLCGPTSVCVYRMYMYTGSNS